MTSGLPSRKAKSLSPSAKRTRFAKLPTAAELEPIWRPDPAFIGPVAPPMLLWLYRGRPKNAWELKAEARHAANQD